MAPVSRPARSVEHTAESLQNDLIRLEAQRQALQRELAAVVAHLGSVQRALGALQAVMGSPAPVPGRATVPVHADAPADADAPVPAGAGRTYGRLTEQVMDFLERAGDAEVRARDVASALGRDGDSGSINAVRSTLDRLVAASRVDRAGRGLYRARRS
ncbi:hypothetical protein PV703_04335 [Streptomyces sp. ME01-24h]|nr:hypothetical protein [Streptomyces sp. ME19-03-3]MDX3352565.1 hypothetical protein [Streptomyces sp. ME01-24h]